MVVWGTCDALPPSSRRREFPSDKQEISHWGIPPYHVASLCQTLVGFQYTTINTYTRQGLGCFVFFYFSFGGSNLLLAWTSHTAEVEVMRLTWLHLCWTYEVFQENSSSTCFLHLTVRSSYQLVGRCSHWNSIFMWMRAWLETVIP